MPAPGSQPHSYLSDSPPQLVEVMVDMASNLMLVDEHLLWLAQREDKACSGIVGALERIGGAALSPHAQHISVVMWVSWEGAARGLGPGRGLSVTQEGSASVSGSKASKCVPAMSPAHKDQTRLGSQLCGIES